MDTLAPGTHATGPDAGLRGLRLQSLARQAEGVLQEEETPAELTGG